MENENSESAGTEPKIIKGQIDYVLKFTEKDVEIVYSPQTDHVNLVALLIANECAMRAKENLTTFLNQNRGEKSPEIKKAKDRLNWAGKTSTGLGIQIQALIEMIAYSNNPDVIKEQRQVMANEMIKKMEAQIKAGETPEGMTITKQNDILDT